MIRNTHRIGDHLCVDDESGLVFYASDMVKDWDGQMRHKDNLDGRHPQLDVAKAVRRDPQPLQNIRSKNESGLPGWFLLLESANGPLNQDAISLEDHGTLLTES